MDFFARQAYQILCCCLCSLRFMPATTKPASSSLRFNATNCAVYPRPRSISTAVGARCCMWSHLLYFSFSYRQFAVGNPYRRLRPGVLFQDHENIYEEEIKILEAITDATQCSTKCSRLHTRMRYVNGLIPTIINFTVISQNPSLLIDCRFHRG